MHRALVCPACGASDPGPSDPAGFGACAYCGVKFKLDRRGQAHTLKEREARPPAALAALLIGFLVAAGLGVVLAFRSSPEPMRPEPVPPAEVRLVEPLASTSLKPVETATPVPVAATASFAEHSRRSGSDGSLWVLGLVTNTSPFPLGKVEIIAVLQDSAGAELTTANGYSKRDVLAPNEASPLVLLIQDPPAFASVAYELVAKKPSYLPARAEGLRIESGAPSATDYGAWEAQGKVFNDGPAAAKFVKVEVQAWDVDDKLVGISEGYAKAESLQPGASARFKTMGMQTASKPARFELFVDGRAEK